MTATDDEMREEALRRVEQLLAEVQELTIGWRLWGYGDCSALHASILELIARDRDPIPPPRPSSNVSTGLAMRLVARDGYQCAHCGTTEQLTIDHVTPVSKGGLSELDNLQILCKPCNTAKGDRT